MNQKLLILAISILCSLIGFGQVGSGKKVPLVKITVAKMGPYIGLQKGKYTLLELGGEYQWKRVKLKSPTTHAGHMGFNYNFKYNVLGYDAGYWIKPHRIGLTYGANAVFRTDFDRNRFGVAPVIGFKFWFAHLQTGYHFLPNLPADFQTNTLFISLRVGIINNRDVDFEWRKRKKKDV